MAFTIPGRHSRNSAWGIWLILPLLNIIGFWVYAFTLAVARSHLSRPPPHRLPPGRLPIQSRLSSGCRRF